jgi:hypothetical protein
MQRSTRFRFLYLCFEAGNVLGPFGFRRDNRGAALVLDQLPDPVKLSPEIAEYSETNRLGVLARLGPDETGRPRTMMYVGKQGDSLYYREGE